MFGVSGMGGGAGGGRSCDASTISALDRDWSVTAWELEWTTYLGR